MRIPVLLIGLSPLAFWLGSGVAAPAGPGRSQDIEVGTGPENGCTLSLSLAKEAFQKGEPVQLDLAYENLSSSGLTLWSCGLQNHLLVVSDEGGREPELTPAGRMLRLRYLTAKGRDGNVKVVVEPGGVSRSKLDLTAFYRLEPGRYVLVVVYDERMMPPRLTFASDPLTFTVAE